MPHHRLGCASVPALRSRRLRRRQGLRVPDDPRGRSRAHDVRIAAERNGSGEIVMRLAIVRQRYTPYGGAERFIENALEALLERNVAITLYTRQWPQTSLALLEPHIIDPLHIGGLWRDWGFARAACRAVGRAQLDLVQSHERLLCCDIFRAGDGVHATWLEERLKAASPARRLGVALSLHHRYTLA